MDTDDAINKKSLREQFVEDLKDKKKSPFEKILEKRLKPSPYRIAA